ncbi:MAG TPA: LacI family DNA-binding transcriptional regulator [Microvirga sp.]|nr:LacI family DNA-binding transcriptional regulator [Microvirga sp.]
MSRSRLSDIADACSVSISTASRALAGHKGVRSDLRQRILEAARAANYPVALDLTGSRVVVAASRAAMTDYSRTQFTWHVLEGLKSRSAARGFVVELQPLADDADAAEQLAGSPAVADATGILLLTVDDPRVLALVAESGKPAVLINGDDPLMRISSVSPCNRSAARLACDYLLGLGHREVAFVMRPGRETIWRRLEGWRDALAARGYTGSDERVLRVSDWVPEEAERVFGEAFDSGRLAGVTGVLCAGDTLALGVLAALSARGIACPDKVSVVGIDDLPISDLLKPRLTTMHIPARELGETAIDMLADQALHRQRMARRVELACQLIVRESSGRNGFTSSEDSSSSGER